MVSQPLAAARPSYADAKVLFVSNNFGTSLTRINAVSIVSIASYALFASLVRYSAALAANTSDHSAGNSLEHWILEVRTQYQRCLSGSKTQVSMLVAIEAVIFILPLLLSLTVFSSTGTATALSLFLFALAAGFYQQSQQLQSTRSKKRRSSDDEDSADDTTTLHSQSDLHDGRDQLRNRRAPAKAAHRRAPSRSTKTYSESDDDELEAELVEKRSIQHRRLASESNEMRVSVESAADQAWNAANPPQSWTEPEAAGKSDASLSGSDFRGRRRDPIDRGSGIKDASQDHDPFLTIYRSHMMLITIACILAVDFPIFPRELGKCETWGASLMDLGVGSFVFSLGVVSAGPYLKPTRPSLLSILRRDMTKSLPLFALGMIRVISVKMTSYPEHVTEYGVHWNFFLTLAALPILKTGIEAMRRVVGGRWSTWGLMIGFFHQILLSFTPLQAYVLSSTPRTVSLLAANREGICSVPGYLSILLLSVDLGLYILPRTDPYQAFRRVSLEEVEERKRHNRVGSDGRVDLKAIQSQGVKKEGKRLASLTAILGSWAIIYWSLHLLVAFCLSLSFPTLASDLALGERADGLQMKTSINLAISRRLANMPYVLWVAAFNVSFLAAYTSVYWLFLLPVKWSSLSAQEHDSRHGHGHGYGSPPLPSLPLTPHLFNLINDHAFPIFLLSNILTGLVNLSLSTMYTSHLVAFVVLVAYMLAVCIGGPVWILPLVGLGGVGEEEEGGRGRGRGVRRWVEWLVGRR
ncbi:hypothetical protein BCV69DRAFT_314922 [Microstroma glucosiphilum]|uniref:GPI-anchored wall transfer protein 1 n=1 Tax=Pseudomicrostroma glucosiphilum TaxID=1684307 RepID=A0A316TYD8_9BASI|nr:hypothetical protein BCV69DRAFT_314922 [Pseudomicrostroma glucosiphilum]PWN18080.1 hypothetical protein BCV69DRAFT_314922 [Pseudomicrostroma glucosiphilum]